jgi:hypothetical protein
MSVGARGTHEEKSLDHPKRGSNGLGEKRTRSELAKLLERLVDLVGIEPTTSSMPWKRAPKLRHRPTCCRMQLVYCLCWNGIRQLWGRQSQ